MAPVTVTDDYYIILEVEPTAERQTIVTSYRRLALKLHPDRNRGTDTTSAFQLLQRAYETLEDVERRRDYDCIYPSIRKRHVPPKTAPNPQPTSASASASTARSSFLSEAAQIAALEKSKQERAARWHISKNAFDTTIFEIQRNIRKLEQEIRNLNDIASAEAKVEAQENSWGAWLLSPFYKKPEESEDVKARKNIERQERRIEKDMKERRLQTIKINLKMQDDNCRIAKEQIDAADRVDDVKLRNIRATRLARENREREEREKEEEAKMTEWLRKWREEQAKRQREEAEATRKRQAEAQAAEQKRRQEEQEKRQHQHQSESGTRARGYPQSSFTPTDNNTQGTKSSNCVHGGWWPKVEGRAPCPKCHDVWTYLLQCPGCGIKACPKCQAVVRPRRPHGRPTAAPRYSSSYEDPEPTTDWDDYY